MNCIAKKAVTGMMALSIIGMTGLGICGGNGGGSVFSDTSISASAATISASKPIAYSQFSCGTNSIRIKWTTGASNVTGFRIYPL